METYNAPQRPMTPPSDRKPVQIINESNIPYLETAGQNVPINKVPYMNNDSALASERPIADSNLNRTHNNDLRPSNKNPFGKNKQHNEHRKSYPTDGNANRNRKSEDRGLYGTERHQLDQYSQKNTSRERQGNTDFDGRLNNQWDTGRTSHENRRAEKSLNDTLDSLLDDNSSSRTTNSRVGTRQYNVSRQRNDTTHRIEREVLEILQWHNPVRSGLILGLIVTSNILAHWYSPLQIASSMACIATGINLIYVNFILQSQRIITNQDVAHPYSDVISDDRQTVVDRDSVNHFSNVLTDISETVIRALTRIVFVENTTTSLKWMAIFFLVWKTSSVISTMNLLLIGAISAFIFPRLYISNKDIVDAHLHKGQTILQKGINKAHQTATDAVQNSYTKSRVFAAKVGTTGTDAKNTLSKTSAVLKED